MVAENCDLLCVRSTSIPTRAAGCVTGMTGLGPGE